MTPGLVAEASREPIMRTQSCTVSSRKQNPYLAIEKQNPYLAIEAHGTPSALTAALRKRPKTLSDSPTLPHPRPPGPRLLPASNWSREVGRNTFGIYRQREGENFVKWWLGGNVDLAEISC